MRRLARGRGGRDPAALSRRRARSTTSWQAGFDPVTEADREAERAIRALIRGRVSRTMASWARSMAPRTSTAEHVWVIDPIDGTRAFISGMPVWGTLVGLTVDGDAVAGMMSQPFTGELFYADRRRRALSRARAGARALATRKTTALADAILFTTTPALFKGDGARALRPAGSAGAARRATAPIATPCHARGRPCRPRRRSRAASPTTSRR